MTCIRKIDYSVAKLMQSQVTIKDVIDVVKELLENSVDSHAKCVTLRYKKSPVWQVWCNDDGDGIEPDEMELVGSRSCTSKFHSNDIQRLERVQTFGFRGEAVHSISQISSRFEITTRPRDSKSTYKLTFVKGEKLGAVQLQDSLDAHGTLVMASNIFGNFPVRVKQLDKLPESVLVSKLRDVVFAIATMYPHVKFKIYKVDELNAESLLTSVGGHQANFSDIVTANLRDIYGISIPHSNETFDTVYEGYHCKCLISLQTVHSKSYQFIFINKRKVMNKNLLKFINSIFENSGFNEQGQIVVPNFSKNQLSPRKVKSPTKIVGKSFIRHPVFVMDVECKPSVSDLIQDRLKLIYESKHLDTVRLVMTQFVKTFLQNHGYNTNFDTPKRQLLEELKSTNYKEKRSAMNLLVNTKSKISKLSENESLARLASFATPSYHQSINFPNLKLQKGVSLSSKHLCHDDHQIGKIDILETKSQFFPTVSELLFSKDDLQDVHVIGQVDKKFILVRLQVNGQTVLLIVDQHACDERIRVEALLREFIEDKQQSIQLETVLTITMSEAECTMLKECIPSFSACGIQYSVNSKFISITHLPIIISTRTKDINFIRNLLIQHCYDLQNNDKLKILPSTRLHWWQGVQYLPRLLVDLLNSKACRSAIMFGDELTKDQCCQYITQLKDCILPFQCAHGRPSIVPLVDIDNE